MSVSALQNQNRLTIGPYISELNSVLRKKNVAHLFTALIIYKGDILSHTTFRNNRPHERDYALVCH